MITNGKGRLFLEPLLPQEQRLDCVTGKDLYRIGGKAYPPSRDTGRATQCRIEISPAAPAAFDCFLNVLTVTESDVTDVDRAVVRETAGDVAVSVGNATVVFGKDRLEGRVRTGPAQPSQRSPR